ncbi:MAG: outer membrane beta-barrel protein, partial [Nitrospirota bacterium]
MLLLLLLGLVASPLHAEEPQAERTDWHYGTYLDLNYTVNFNFPENHQFRSRTTTSRGNELSPNVALGYVRKDITAQSRWGMELAVQGGYDTKEFAFGQDRPLLGGADTLRHFSRANVSYLAPVGKGLTLTAGLFNSLIGYESLYAKDNANYTRSWIADNSPYMMFGLGARYPVSDDLTASLYVINGYWHLANPNSLPSYLTQLVWQPTGRVTVTENLYYGPDQRNTNIEFWRLFSDYIIEWKGENLTVAFSYDFGTENIAG